MSVRRILLAAEALFFLLISRIVLRWLPVRWLLAFAARAPSRRPCPAGNVLSIVREIRWAVLAVERHSPVQFVCFPQCLAALTMLRIRGIESRLLYGVTRIDGVLATHTWLQAGGVDVIGGEAAGEFSLLASF